jgi:hypothetical protein
MPATTIVRMRTAAFVAIAAFLLVGPAWTQVLDRESPVVPQWQMFVGYGLDVCKVRYAMVEGDAVTIPLDRYRTLGFTDRFDAPRQVWRVPSADVALGIGQRMCRKVGEPSPDIRVWATCARRSGWKNELNGETNVCRMSRRSR